MIDAANTHDSRRGGILAALALIFLVALLCLVGTAYFFAHNIKVHEARSGDDVRVDTPLGSVHVQHNRETPESAGIPLYPGAKTLHNGESASVDLSSFLGNKDLHIVAGKWETSDPVAKVQQFYQHRFPDMRVKRCKDGVEMHSDHGDNKRVIVLRRVAHSDGESTLIALASVGEPRAN